MLPVDDWTRELAEDYNQSLWIEQDTQEELSNEVIQKKAVYRRALDNLHRAGKENIKLFTQINAVSKQSLGKTHENKAT